MDPDKAMFLVRKNRHGTRNVFVAAAPLLFLFCMVGVPRLAVQQASPARLERHSLHVFADLSNDAIASVDQQPSPCGRREHVEHNNGTDDVMRLEWRTLCGGHVPSRYGAIRRRRTIRSRLSSHGSDSDRAAAQLSL